MKPHDLRRTFGTWYLQENPGQLIECIELTGHSNLSQVRKYALSDTERARAGVAKLLLLPCGKWHGPEPYPVCAPVA